MDMNGNWPDQLDLYYNREASQFDPPGRREVDQSTHSLGVSVLKHTHTHTHAHVFSGMGLQAISPVLQVTPVACDSSLAFFQGF